MLNTWRGTHSLPSLEKSGFQTICRHKKSFLSKVWTFEVLFHIMHVALIIKDKWVTLYEKSWQMTETNDVFSDWQWSVPLRILVWNLIGCLINISWATSDELRKLLFYYEDLYIIFQSFIKICKKWWEKVSLQLRTKYRFKSWDLQ